MKDLVKINKTISIPLNFHAAEEPWKIIGGGAEACQAARDLLKWSPELRLSIISPAFSKEINELQESNASIVLHERKYEAQDLSGMVVIATGNKVLDESIQSETRGRRALVWLPGNKLLSDFSLAEAATAAPVSRWYQPNNDQFWKKLASRLVLAFVLMVIGHIIISYLPLPSLQEIWTGTRPYFNREFLFFVISGFLAQMVDGMLSMGYGVTSATCLMSFNVAPVSVSAAIHTSEIFTTGISGYSHYKFGNVNKKLFRHLVIPGVIGAVLGALMLVFLGERYSKYLMPLIALYAGFLGLKILIKAFGEKPGPKKVKRIGWLAWAGGFLDSFGGGGWGPIVTSSLISKGRSPRYTVGSVSLTEFFVTLASAFTFFITVGVSHWNIVLGLILGGSIAAPIAARFTGKLPRKTMMILVGLMVMVWCARMLVKSLL